MNSTQELFIDIREGMINTTFYKRNSDFNAEYFSDCKFEWVNGVIDGVYNHRESNDSMDELTNKYSLRFAKGIKLGEKLAECEK